MKKKMLFLLVLLGILSGCGKEEEPIISLYQADSKEIVEMPLEEYLCGVVAAEMATDWPEEALQAQAILARTFTLEKMQNGGVPKRGTDASTDVEEFQAYDAKKINQAVREAVKETEGEVVTYNGKLIKAWFFADGGGVTAATALEGLGYDKEKTPYIHSVRDPGIDLQDNENRAWEVSFTLDEVKKALEQVNGLAPKQITNVEITAQGQSGRATKIAFNDMEVGAAAFRLAIGSEKMKSNLLEDIQIEDQKLIIKGKGYGHGVGMSQWGAKAMAIKGEDAEDIIRYFFKDVTIEQWYD